MTSVTLDYVLGDSFSHTPVYNMTIAMARRDTPSISQSTQMLDVGVALQETIQMYNLTPDAGYGSTDAENDTAPSNPSLTQGMYIFRAYLSPIIILLGIIGNVMSIGIFVHYRKWDQASIHYLFYLALSDTGNLLFNGVVEWFHIGLKYASKGQFWIDIPAMNLGTCIFVRYVWLHCAFMSSWILVFFTIERFLVVCFPIRAVKWVTVGRRRRILAIMTVFSVVSWFPIPFIYDVYQKHGFSVCLPNSSKSSWMSSYFSFHSIGTTFFLPCVLLALFNTFIIIGLAKTSKGRQEIRGGKKSKKQDVMIALNLLAVSSVYLTLTIPFCLSWSIWFYWEATGFEGKTLQEIRDGLEANRFITSISIINYSVNFCIYTARLPFFKRRVLSIFGFKKYKKIDSSNNMSLQNGYESPRTKTSREHSRSVSSKIFRPQVDG